MAIDKIISPETVGTGCIPPERVPELADLLKELIAAREKLFIAKKALDEICVAVIYDESRGFGQRMCDINEIANTARDAIK